MINLRIPHKLVFPSLSVFFSLPTFAASVSRGGTSRHSFSPPDSPCKCRFRFSAASFSIANNVTNELQPIRSRVYLRFAMYRSENDPRLLPGMILHPHIGNVNVKPRVVEARFPPVLFIHLYIYTIQSFSPDLHRNQRYENCDLSLSLFPD